MSELLDGWRRLPLETLVSEGPSNGYSPQSGGDAQGTLSLKLSATTSGRFVLDDSTTKRIYEDVPPDSKLWLMPGDILIQRSNTMEYVGTAALFEGPARQYIYPDLMMRVRARRDIVDPEYLVRALNAPSARAALRAKATGTAGNMPKINGETVRNLLLDVPPLPEQRRIVAKLDTLQSKSRRAKEALDAIPPLLERFRQSVLSAAFRGDLTAEWRARNPDVEPASELLKRIRAERRRRWEESELAKMKSKGKPPTDDRWKAKYEEPEPAGTDGLPELPDGWCWSTVDAATTHIVDCLHRTPPYVDEGIPAIRTADVVPGRLLLEQARRVSTSTYLEQIERLEPRPGDILYSREGERFGLAAAVPDGVQLCMSQRMMQLRVVEPIHSAFFMWALNSPGVYSQAARDVGGSTSPHVNIRSIRRFTIPIPPLGEQQEIAGKLESAWTSSDTAAKTVQEAAAQTAILDNTILDRALSGKLVPQDPDDEPASALLARLAAERAAPAPAGSTPPPRRAKRASAKPRA